MAETLCKIDSISYSYDGKNDVLKDFSADFIRGECTAIMAPSGSGKTTLLNVIAGLLMPSLGTVSYYAKKPAISYDFQENRLLENLSVKKNLTFVNSKLTEDDITDALTSLNLSGYANKKAGALSGGEMRRVALIRTILCNSEIVLLDEPFTGLDEENTELCINFIKEHTKNRAVVLVTHSPEISSYFDKIIYLA